jgi:hypothetical protein
LKAKPKLSSSLPNVNPPASTRPAELDLPAKIPNTVPFSQKAAWVFSMGRGYLQFYKAGLKNVYHNYKASLSLRTTLGLPRYLPTSLPPARGRHGPSSAALVAQMESLSISRADFQLVRRSAHDIRRMLPFALVLLVCGEFTPIVVLALGNAVTPLACRLPNQNRATREKRFLLKRQALQATQADLGSVTPILSGSNEEMKWLAQNFGNRDLVASSRTASAQMTLRGCAVFGLVKSLKRAPWWVPLIYRPRLIRWVEYLELDDKMLLRGGGVEALNAEEVRIAVEERGGVSFEDSNLSPAQSVARDRDWLTRWFAARKSILELKD